MTPVVPPSALVELLLAMGDVFERAWRELTPRERAAFLDIAACRVARDIARLHLAEERQS